MRDRPALPCALTQHHRHHAFPVAPPVAPPLPHRPCPWHAVYLLVGAYVGAQALPRHSSNPLLAPLRPWIALGLACNCSWLVLFGHELFWTALLVLGLYALSLYKLVALIGLDLTQTAEPSYGIRLLAHCAFAANASWVTVATLLQLQINLLDEGYSASSDLTVAMLMLAVAIGSYRALVAADLPWAAIGAWALTAIRANQSAGSDWGCLPGICAACKAGAQRICTNRRAPPLGWTAACANKLRIASPDGCLLERSETVAAACQVGIALIAVALVAGVARGLAKKRVAKKSEEEAVAYRGM
jgi:hypothetical protein